MRTTTPRSLLRTSTRGSLRLTTHPVAGREGLRPPRSSSLPSRPSCAGTARARPFSSATSARRWAIITAPSGSWCGASRRRASGGPRRRRDRRGAVRAARRDRARPGRRPERLDRLALPGEPLPPVLPQRDRLEPIAQRLERAAGLDRRQLARVAGEDELAVCVPDEIEQLLEVACAEHAGLVDDQHGALAAERAAAEQARDARGAQAGLLLESRAAFRRARSRDRKVRTAPTPRARRRAQWSCRFPRRPMTDGDAVAVLGEAAHHHSLLVREERPAVDRRVDDLGRHGSAAGRCRRAAVSRIGSRSRGARASSTAARRRARGSRAAGWREGSRGTRPPRRGWPGPLLRHLRPR